MKQKSKQRVGLLTLQDSFEWKSCVSITSNLRQAYQSLDPDRLSITPFVLRTQDARQGIQTGNRFFLDVAEQIWKSKITDLVFLDHRIDPRPILFGLRCTNPGSFAELRTVFHVYGDFSLNPDIWSETGKILDGKQVQFLCASDRQVKYVSFFLAKNDSAVKLCPFPVNAKAFRFSEKSRREWRERIGITDAQTLLLYTGRLSLQKGIVRLTDEFARLCSTGRNDLKLAIAGPYDDLGCETSGYEIPPGFYFHHLQEHLKTLPRRIREKIVFVGDLEHDDLRKIYSAGDLYVSLSLHHDEDFGMCPAEALVSGLPAVITDWAGYGSFEKPNVNCRLIPVLLNDRGLTIPQEEVFESLSSALTQPRLSSQERLRNGDDFGRHFSIPAIAQRLSDLLNPGNFTSTGGFNWSLGLLERGEIKGKLYQDVYTQYVRQPSL